MDLLLGWVFASSCAVLGVLCRVQELLPCCWSEPCCQYLFQMLTAVSPLQMHGGLVNNNSPKNPVLSSIWKALGLWHVQDLKGWVLNLLPGNSGEDLLWALSCVVWSFLCQNPQTRNYLWRADITLLMWHHFPMPWTSNTRSASLPHCFLFP